MIKNARLAEKLDSVYNKTVTLSNPTTRTYLRNLLLFTKPNLFLLAPSLPALRDGRAFSCIVNSWNFCYG